VGFFHFHFFKTLALNRFITFKAFSGKKIGVSDCNAKKG
jgi:hypothetical protein